MENNNQTTELKSTFENYCGEIILRRTIDETGKQGVYFDQFTALEVSEEIQALMSLIDALTKDISAGKFDTTCEDAPTVNAGSLIFIQNPGSSKIQVLNRTNLAAKRLCNLLKNFVVRLIREESNQA